MKQIWLCGRSNIHKTPSQGKIYIIKSNPNAKEEARGGGTQYKRPYGDVPPTLVAKSAFWYMNNPL